MRLLYRRGVGVLTDPERAEQVCCARRARGLGETARHAVQALMALVVQNESAVTEGLRRKAWIRGYPSPLGEYQRRVRSWGLRRKRERVWR